MNRYPSNFSEILIATARGQVGKKEVGKNGGQAVRAYQSATWMDPGPWPWCAAFVCWAVRIAGLGHACPTPPDTPSAASLLAWANHHAARIPPPFRLTPGNIVVYRFPAGHHCGIVVEPLDGGFFTAVEGNTDPTGGREGDGVYLRRRDLSAVVGAISFDF